MRILYALLQKPLAIELVSGLESSWTEIAPCETSAVQTDRFMRLQSLRSISAVSPALLSNIRTTYGG